MYQVIWLYDGVPDKPAAIPMATVKQCVSRIKVMHVQYEKRLAQNPKLELGIVDLETEHLVSYRL
jgi:hypothetical protein